ncbi:hypothetical protein, partial [Lactobacillus helveticus]
LFKNKNREKKRPIKLKLRVELIVFQYLRVGYFPDTFLNIINDYFFLLAIISSIKPYSLASSAVK